MKKRMQFILESETKLEDFYAVSFYRDYEIKLQGDITQSKLRYYRDLGYEFKIDEKSGWFSSTKICDGFRVEITFTLP